jgi:hypothetical protein
MDCQQPSRDNGSIQHSDASTTRATTESGTIPASVTSGDEKTTQETSSLTLYRNVPVVQSNHDPTIQLENVVDNRTALNVSNLRVVRAPPNNIFNTMKASMLHRPTKKNHKVTKLTMDALDQHDREVIEQRHRLPAPTPFPNEKSLTCFEPHREQKECNRRSHWQTPEIPLMDVTSHSVDTIDTETSLACQEPQYWTKEPCHVNTLVNYDRQYHDQAPVSTATSHGDEFSLTSWQNPEKPHSGDEAASLTCWKPPPPSPYNTKRAIATQPRSKIQRMNLQFSPPCDVDFLL